jgi:hypothetical protein
MNPVFGQLFHPSLFAVEVALPGIVLEVPEVELVLAVAVTDSELEPKVVAPGPVQVVTVALTVATPPLYKLQVKTAPLTGVAKPPRLFVNGSVPFLGIVTASKNWLWLLEL